MGSTMKRRVLVCHGKYGDYYYAGDTPEQIAQNALAILTERWNDGHWYCEPDEVMRAKDLAMAGVSDEAIDSYPKGEQGAVRATREWARGHIARDQQDDRWYREAKRAVEQQDCTLALRLLELRNDHEYESVTVEPLREGDEA